MLQHNIITMQYVIGVHANGNQVFLGAYPRGMNLWVFQSTQYDSYVVGNLFDYLTWNDARKGIIETALKG